MTGLSIYSCCSSCPLHQRYEKSFGFNFVLFCWWNCGDYNSITVPFYLPFLFLFVPPIFFHLLNFYKLLLQHLNHAQLLGDKLKREKWKRTLELEFDLMKILYFFKWFHLLLFLCDELACFPANSTHFSAPKIKWTHSKNGQRNLLHSNWISHSFSSHKWKQFSKSCSECFQLNKPKINWKFKVCKQTPIKTYVDHVLGDCEMCIKAKRPDPLHTKTQNSLN